MDQLVQCPVCTLYLHNGMSLESHLDTHPKDQVIKALCSIANKGSNYASRTSTPAHSERSYRSRSRTPATDDSAKWTGSRSTDHERYWRRTPSRTSKSTPVSNTSRNGTPDIRMLDVNFENHGIAGGGSAGQHVSNPFHLKADKLQQTFQCPPVPEFDGQFVYYPEQQEDREIKYSRSAEYNALDNSNNMFSYNVPPMAAPGMKLLPAALRKPNDLVKVLPKPNNILLKANMGGVQYIGSGMKPMHVMVPSTPTFMQKNMQNNMIMTSSVPNPQMHIDTKTTSPPLASSQLNQMTTGAFTPGTTVVTQNSQIIYREMVHNIDGKNFITTMPTVLGAHDNVTNLSQASSMYQNVMVVDQFGNTSCMYATPQQMINKTCPTSIYNESGTSGVPSVLDKSVQSMTDPKTLIIEVGPLVAPTHDNIGERPSPRLPQPVTSTEVGNIESPVETVDPKYEMPGGTKGLKILSNIKVEVPVQHNKNMVNTVMDLTGSNESDYPVERVESPDKILPDLEDNNQLSSDDTQPSSCPSMSSGDSMVSHTFSVIKNVGNPSKSSDSKLDTDFSDSCPVPDLICNEKPSISPCSELSENGDNSTDRTSMSPKPESNQVSHSNLGLPEKKTQLSQKPYRHNALRLNNIFVKKHKKVLQIKNVKALPVSTAKKSEQRDTIPTSSTCKSPENFTMNKMHQTDKTDCKEKTNLLQTISVEEIKENDENFDADTSEQSMDIEALTANDLEPPEYTANLDMIQVKEEINSSNEGAFSNEPVSVTTDRMLTPLETLRPINVINYGNLSNEDFNEESTDRELLDLEAASKNKQFVSMMNENYFGDNIYADYFTADRVEAFDAEREAAGFKEGAKDGMYLWGEPSQKENDFVLPNFIHESYKIAESTGIDYSELGARAVQVDVEVDACEPDCKADVLSEGRSESDAPINICADERMPPRGELSGQESNGDMESPWSGMYTDVTPAEPYDLIARESWVSDGSDVDANEKREPIEEELQLPLAPVLPLPPVFARARVYTCAACGATCTSLKELRAHKSLVHALPTCSASKTSYSRLVTQRAIKKEEKPDTINLLPPIDSKDSISSTILEVYESIQVEEAKPKIEVDRLIKQEVKRRRKDYVCPTCKVDQGSDAHFHAHLKIHPLECLTCGKCFFRRANLSLHIKTHLGIKNYKCEVCEKRFVTRQKLSEHHNTHTGRAPVKCTVCDDTFRRYSNMVQHRDRHHLAKRAKVRDFVCQCGLVLHSRAKLRWHQEIYMLLVSYTVTSMCRDRHHLAKRAKVRDFVCQCGLVLHSRAKLRWHQEIYMLLVSYTVTSMCRDRHHLAKRAKVRDFVCQCGLVLHSRAKLRWHQEIYMLLVSYTVTSMCRDRHHLAKRAKVRDFVCQCGLVLHSRAKLRWHQEIYMLLVSYTVTSMCRDRHHLAKRAKVRDFVCQCGLVLHSRAKLRWHQEIYMLLVSYTVTSMCRDRHHLAKRAKVRDFVCQCGLVLHSRAKLRWHQEIYMLLVSYTVTSMCRDRHHLAKRAKVRDFVCQCGLVLHSRAKLRWHQEIYMLLVSYTVTSMCRDRHHLAKRAKVRDFVCQCGLVLHSRAKLRWHQEIYMLLVSYTVTSMCRDRHHLAKRAKVRDFVCQCGLVLHSRAKLRWHQEIYMLLVSYTVTSMCRDRHHLAKRAKVRDFVCQCGLVLHSRAKLRWHQEIYMLLVSYTVTSMCRDRHHLAKRAKVRDFVCQCGLVLHSRAKLRWHQETHADRPRACLYCSDKFVHAASLTRHVRRSHNEYFLAERHKGKEQENVQCPVCKQVYLRSNLRTHLQTHSGQRPYMCIICNKSFTTKWNLKLHRWTHASRSAKPYKCALCKGAFIRQSEYVSHMNAHKSVRPYTCNYCGCQFIRKYNCQRHVREHEMAKKYVCKVAECGKSFHRSYYLSEHMKVHSGARPFACNICGKTSSNKSNHNKHVRIHHAREPVATEA